ncbi:hypothetical protein SAMN05444369_11042 [Capnocytophaga haemolytica]|uniref:Uncharacterized protein n=1 Tax=Capnocytophaga haemolytica TaxID=45243 RepID=A0AAX2GYJ5_9FLAO|nr:hypothetical protein [Capnocytophaga haemolytica]AMD85421.1 hypothetical protein AXF12_07790 [Capnocytophaga haemolytica]SFO12687.1 hypothetical protein SAMN05444369_11042 [Capnocytophaga haemolytica]SNV01798.1 Uncharacterised protein [Capnocytophaga haemolytica]
MELTAADINASLRRPIQSGLVYAAFMPASDCSSTWLVKGNTSLSIANMKETALKYRHHTEKLQKQFFNDKNLEKLCRDIHDFLFNNIQYKLDGEKQLLRSPACTWVSRNDGVDCKSYSIFASTILLNAGVKHYMRRIKQASKPDGFTHVYIIVPKNQRTLKKSTLTDYYVIDGTINSLQELPYIEADDVLVEPKKKRGLGAAQQTDYKGDDIDSYLDRGYNDALLSYEQAHKTGSIEGAIKLANENAKIDAASGAITAIATAINPVAGAVVGAVAAVVSLLFRSRRPDPCAGSFYIPDEINNNLKNRFNESFKKSMLRVQEHINKGTEAAAVNELNSMLKNIDLGIAHFTSEIQKESNPCSKAALIGYTDFVGKIAQIIENFLVGLKAVMGEYYNVTEVKKKGSTAERTWYFIIPNGRRPVEATYRVIIFESRDKKKGVYPYGTEQNFDDWLNENTMDLAKKYGDSVAKQYYAEMLPFKEKIAAIRKNVYVSVPVQLSMEDKLRAQEYSIYLKYDKEYQAELLAKTKSAKEAYTAANLTFWEELKKIRAQRLYDENRRVENIAKIAQSNADAKAGLEQKKTLNYLLFGAIGLAMLAVIKK